MDRRQNLTDAAIHSGGAIATARWQRHAKQLGKPSLISIAIITAAATLYTLAGGIRAVIWTDVLQAVVFVSAVVVAVWLLWLKMPMGPVARRALRRYRAGLHCVL